MGQAGRRNEVNRSQDDYNNGQGRPFVFFYWGEIAVKQKRGSDIESAHKYRELLVAKADGWIYGGYFWHGWVIVEAYLAGLAAGRRKRAKRVVK